MGVDETSVFLNVPFDRSYEKQFIALIAALISLGRRPRCVLEIPDSGEGRLERIIKHIQSCRVSLHDLSRAKRFNMPFELGIACAVARLNTRHNFFVFQKDDLRLDLRLSDLKGIDHSTHGGTVRGTIACVLDVLHTFGKNPAAESVFRLYADLFQVAKEHKRKYRRSDVFSRSLFGVLIVAGATLASEEGLIRARDA